MTNKPDEQGKGLTILGTNWFVGRTPTGDKGWCIIAPVQR